jgi:Sortase domain
MMPADGPDVPARRRRQAPGGRHRRATPGHYWRGAARRPIAGWPVTAIVTCAMFVTGIGLAGPVMVNAADGSPASLHRIPDLARPAGPHVTLPAPSGRPRAGPVGLIIPAIGVRTRLIHLSTTARGALQVPPTTSVAGWYTRSPVPGAVGASVIAGHVDSYAGPGVFFRLRLLLPGDRIYVRRADGTLVVFRVTSVRTYLKSGFPSAAVYGPAPGPQLHLITCGGAFDPAAGSYLANVVVYAAGVG